jgi:hypothetical protein
MFTRLIATTTLVGVLAAGAVGSVSAQTLGTVTLPGAVLADGRRLAAGTYQIRLTGDVLQPGVGQSPAGERWVEFLRSGTVAGREVATVIPAGDIGAVAKGPRPTVNSSRVDVLRGGDYIRVWINRGNEHYIIHMPAS